MNQPVSAAPHLAAPHLAAQRLAGIARARTAVMREGMAPAPGLLQPWIERSWQRCMARGQRPENPVVFDAVSAQAQRRSAEFNQRLEAAARPVMHDIARALAATRYFALLTNAQGSVVSVQGVLDRSDPRATSIARVGVDLSETAVGTTAIGATLSECAPVWLHRGEHYFNDTGMYSCAGAPIFAPDGACAGMLDFTGIEVPERRELLSLAVHAARQIEVALLGALPYALMLQLHWPADHGNLAAPGALAQPGMLAVGADDRVLGADSVARSMLGLTGRVDLMSLADLFALSGAALWDAALGSPQGLDVPLWSGLRLQVQSRRRGGAAVAMGRPATPGMPLKDLEVSVIRKAVADARGNVSQAAKALGISRATVYRKISVRTRRG